MTGVKVVRKLPEGLANAKKRKKVLTSLSLMTPLKLDGIEEEKEKKEKKTERILLVGDDDDDESDTEDVSEEGEEEQVLYFSDAHVELMLIHALGPRDVFESVSILYEVKMSRDEPFAKLNVATNYVRDWKDAMRWCSKQLPRERKMVERFLGNIVPRKLGLALKSLGVRKIQLMFSVFLTEYKKGVNDCHLMT
jgi:hypothetical protein